MIYTHVLNRPGIHIRSPLDRPEASTSVSDSVRRKMFALYYEYSSNSR